MSPLSLNIIKALITCWGLGFIIMYIAFECGRMILIRETNPSPRDAEARETVKKMNAFVVGLLSATWFILIPVCWFRTWYYKRQHNRLTERINQMRKTINASEGDPENKAAALKSLDDLQDIVDKRFDGA